MNDHSLSFQPPKREKAISDAVICCVGSVPTISLVLYFGMEKSNEKSPVQ